MNFYLPVITTNQFFSDPGLIDHHPSITYRCKDSTEALVLNSVAKLNKNGSSNNHIICYFNNTIV